jgi:hypothetical protein
VLPVTVDLKLIFLGVAATGVLLWGLSHILDTVWHRQASSDCIESIIENRIDRSAPITESEGTLLRRLRESEAEIAANPKPGDRYQCEIALRAFR